MSASKSAVKSVVKHTVPAVTKALEMVRYGWELSRITNLISGPDIVSAGSPNLGLGGSVTGAASSIGLSPTPFLGTPDVMLMPTVLCDPAAGLGKHQYANGNCFGVPLTLGTDGVYRLPYLHGPAYINNDLALSRNMKIRDSQNVQLRLAAFNYLNHANNSFNSKRAERDQSELHQFGNHHHKPNCEFSAWKLHQRALEFGFAPLKGGEGY